MLGLTNGVDHGICRNHPHDHKRRMALHLHRGNRRFLRRIICVCLTEKARHHNGNRRGGLVRLSLSSRDAQDVCRDVLNGVRLIDASREPQDVCYHGIVKILCLVGATRETQELLIGVRPLVCFQFPA